MAEGSIPEIVINELVSLNQTVHVPILSTNDPQSDSAFLSPDSRSRRPISLDSRSHSPSPTFISSNDGASLVVPPTLSTQSSVHVVTLSLRDNKSDELNRRSSLHLLKPPMDNISIHQQHSIALSTQNLSRFTSPLSHQTSPLTPPNVAPPTQPIPSIHIPDLTSFINRCCLYAVFGGGYGDIHKCVYHGPDGDEEVAVKAIRSFVSPEMLRRELGIWKRLQHKNILKFMGTTRGFCPSVALVAPWIANGNLTSFLSLNNETLTLCDRLLLLRDIATGLDYLHTFSFNVDGHAYSNAVVHGDVTGNNVLIGSDGTAYLADFGLSGTLKKLPGMTYLANMNCPGALRWTAPELLDEESAPEVTAQSDMYSFGCIVLQVLTGNIPWPHLIGNFAIWRRVVIDGEIHPRPDDNRITNRHWNFMTRCWSKKIDDRPSAEEALQFIDSELVLHDRGGINVAN